MASLYDGMYDKNGNLIIGDKTSPSTSAPVVEGTPPNPDDFTPPVLPPNTEQGVGGTVPDTGSTYRPPLPSQVPSQATANAANQQASNVAQTASTLMQSLRLGGRIARGFRTFKGTGGVKDFSNRGAMANALRIGRTIRGAAEAREVKKKKQLNTLGLSSGVGLQV